MHLFYILANTNGSGADTIVKGCQENKWGMPIIEEKAQPDTVTLILNTNDLANVIQGVTQTGNVTQGVTQGVTQTDKTEDLSLLTNYAFIG